MVKNIINSIGMEFVLVPSGSFLMGSPATERYRIEDEIQHKVAISRCFYIGKYCVSQSDYSAVYGRNPSFFQGRVLEKRAVGLNIVDKSRLSNVLPVEQLSWEDAYEFSKAVSSLPEESEEGRSYRLPTEAEWEYACRAGCQAAFTFGESDENLDAFAWHNENSKSSTRDIRIKSPNAFGIVGMHGNVYEWCSDWYGSYQPRSVVDPKGPSRGPCRIRRGGCWNDEPQCCRSAYRLGSFPRNYDISSGIRLVLEVRGK
jgi:formylglycine-generating enzyme required for sulfatase activity